MLKISKNMVIRILKKAGTLVRVNPHFRPETGGELAVRLEMACPETELDEQWSYVGDKSNQRWLWYTRRAQAVDHTTNTILAYVFGKRKDTVFEELNALLEPFGIHRFYAGDLGAWCFYCNSGWLALRRNNAICLASDDDPAPVWDVISCGSRVRCVALLLP